MTGIFPTSRKNSKASKSVRIEMNKFDWRKPLLFLVIVGLGSCDNMQRKPEPTVPERDVRVGGNEFVMRADLKCPLYVMPAFPDEPELPLDVLKSNPKMTYKE